MADIEEAQEILEALGMPPAQHNQMAGMTLIALCGLTVGDHAKARVFAHLDSLAWWSVDRFGADPQC